MAIEFYSSIDLNQNELQHPRLQQSGSDPTSPTPVSGQLYYNSGDNTVRYHNGTSWLTLSTTTGDITGVTAGTGLNGGGSSGAVTLNIDAAQTGITSLLATDIKIGEDDQTKIDFETADTINFYAANAKEMVLVANALTPGTSDGTALGTGSLMWSDLFLASGSVINFNNGDMTITHSSNKLSFSGGAVEFTISATDINVNDGCVFVDSSDNALIEFGANALTFQATNTSVSGNLNVAADIIHTGDTNNKISFGTDTQTFTTGGTARLTIADASTTIANAAIFSSSVSVADEIIHSGDTNNTIAFGTDTQTFSTGGSSRLDLSDSGLRIGGSGARVTTIENNDSLGTSDTKLATQGNVKAYVDGKTFDDVSVANLKTRLAGGFGSNAVTIGDSDDVVTIGNDLVITGDLTVSGDTITANVGTLNVEDKNIILNQGSSDTSSTADGAGITIQDAVDASNDATLLWNASSDKFVFSHLIEAPGTSIFTNLDISGDVDVDGTLETDALTIGGSAVLAQATASAVGAVELATAAEVITGTDAARVVTADTLSAKSVVCDIDVSSLTDQNIVTITHNLGTADIIVQVYDKTTEANIMCDIARTTDDFSTASTSVVSIDFGTAPPNDCRALITSLAGATAGSIAYT